MMRRSTRGFTLAELVTYLALFTSSLALLMGFELASRRTIQNQATQIDVLFEADALFEFLDRDVALSRSIKIDADSRGVTIGDGKDSIRYSMTKVRNASQLTRSPPGGLERARKFLHFERVRFSQTVPGELVLECAAVKARDPQGRPYFEIFAWTFNALAGTSGG